MVIKSVSKVPIRIRLEKQIADVLVETARGLHTTKTWVVASALLEYFKNKLPPGFVIGQPTVEDDNEEDNDAEINKEE
jgi:hypothetical protein